ncbi:MAG TPA: FAD-binding oxidoreductase [Aggregatilineales bacterium]|nr:FAD-binding oxidoreductase [Aggregatilineales bacterium]
MDNYQSWGHNPKVQNARVDRIGWRHELPDLEQYVGTVLPRGLGRSYGDSCLNGGGTLLDMTGMRRFITFDQQSGLLRCEAGVTLADVLDVVVPRGWFLPVTPGTKYVTIGGAIANDIHGKNHHAAGTFGRYVTQFELLRSDGSKQICSPVENAELYHATIGGLGLTGLITWAEFTLRKIPGPYIDSENIRFGSIEEFFDVTEEDKNFEYTVAWVDCVTTGKGLGRGVYMRGNHSQRPYQPIKPELKLTVPLNFPEFVLNRFTARAFNEALYRVYQRTPRSQKVVLYRPFFYPLDIALEWYRLYGKRGFFQYQFVVPYTDNYRAIKEILNRIARSGEGSFLGVLKKFGDMTSPGMLSFPRPGVTVALDFPNNGARTLRLFEDLDMVVRSVGGAVYPAKDGRMSAESFQCYYPNWREFSQYIDPKFSSSFWRRVTAPTNGGKS